MASYCIVYGGQVHVDADSTEEAYQKFWERIKAYCDERRIGLITHRDGHPVHEPGT